MDKKFEEVKKLTNAFLEEWGSILEFKFFVAPISERERAVECRDKFCSEVCQLFEPKPERDTANIACHPDLLKKEILRILKEVY